jgi:hypothetical protein
MMAVRLHALDVGHETHAAGVVLAGGVVQAVLLPSARISSGSVVAGRVGWLMGISGRAKRKTARAYRSAAKSTTPNKWGQNI